MVSLKNRKRRRSQAFPHATEEEAPTPVEDSPMDLPESVEAESTEHDAANGEKPADESEKVDPERLEKELAIWDAFREEYFEALEQLPLSLHRAFSLIKELDIQTTDLNSGLLSTLQEYLQLRGAITQPTGSSLPDSSTAQGMSQSNSPAQAPSEDPPPEEVPRFTRRSSTRSPVKNATKPPASPRLPPQQRAVSSASSVQPIPPRQRSASLLTKIARLSEDLVRASNEKINVARYTNDIVNRHIKDLDRAIKEQETSISLGLRPGTHPASIILPDVVVPKSRPTGVTLDDSDSDAAVEGVAEEPPIEFVPEPAEEERPIKTPRKKGRVRHARKKSDVEGRENVEPEKMEKPDGSPDARSARNSRSLKLTLPARSTINASKEASISPNEPRYCYCNQVSYGEMIGCDGPDCQREWFHVGCLGMEQLPTTSSWYCPDCRKRAPKRRKGR